MILKKEQPERDENGERQKVSESAQIYTKSEIVKNKRSTATLRVNKKHNKLDFFAIKAKPYLLNNLCYFAEMFFFFLNK